MICRSFRLKHARSTNTSIQKRPVWIATVTNHRYNAKNGCKNGAKCHFAHVCSLCFQNRYWKALHLSPSEAENGRAWIGGFLELVDGCHGPWFSLEVKPEWAP